MFERLATLGDKGNVALTFSFSILVLMGSAGGAIDYARAYSNKSELRKATDSAALGAASLAEGSADARKAEATKIFLANYNANRFLPATPQVESGDGIVKVSAISALPTTFLRVLGINTLNLNSVSAARSEEATGAGSRICVLALNPSIIQGIYMHGSGEIKAPTCRFHTNSNHPIEALKLQGSGIATTAGMCAAGASLADASFTATPMPRSNCGVISDPLASWLPPLVPLQCTYGVANGMVVGMQISAQDVVTLSPGRYCGDVRINAANVVLEPGRYFFTNGSVAIIATADVVGEGVYIHVDPTMKGFDVKGSANIRLTHAQDASLRGVVLYKAPDLSGGSNFKSSINGNSDVSVNGVIYSPKDAFLMGGNSSMGLVQKPDVTLIADTVELQGSTYLEISADPTGGSGGALFPQVSVAAARLIQ